MIEEAKLPDGATLTSQINKLDALISAVSNKIFGDRPTAVAKEKEYKSRIGDLIERVNDMIDAVGEINKELEKLGK